MITVTAKMFIQLFALVGTPTSEKAAVLLAASPEDELPNLLVALYISGVAIPAREM